MGDMYLGYASFSYYAKTKYGYNFEKSGKEHISFICEGKQFFLELDLDGRHAECGYLYINVFDLKEIFTLNKKLAEKLQNECWRRKGALLPGEKDWHCHIDPSLWGNIEAKVEASQTVVCIHPPEIP